ncbi:ceramide synthase 5-like [Babylonia areolata]|uniref:ceramide synthase 5-like n=1 Tax=Babylonia areolata TaxID=304850 RepID=UPI003FD641D9
MKNNDPSIYKPQLADLINPVYMCFVICGIRFVFERCVALAVSRRYKLRSKARKAARNPILEAQYHKGKCPSTETMEALSKQTDLHLRQIERWFRVRRSQDKTPVMKKFCESSWRCTYYAVIFFYGLHTLWDEPWLWDTIHCWVGWPQHHVGNDVYWYYNIQAGFYLSLSVSLFTDHKRKDFTEMIVHHAATLGLMFLSWMTNLTRIGTLVLLLHDCVDPIMEAAKMAKYLKKEALCTTLFICFVIVWVITRMTIYPFRILRSTLFEAVPVVGMCDIYYAFNGLLITLQVLHIIWFFFILLIAKDVLFEGQPKKDSRSSDETVSEEEGSSSGHKECRVDALREKNSVKLMEQNGLSAHRTTVQ